MIGRTLAHYRITSAIGAGGMGQVYRATDTRLGREVALKILPAEAAANPEMTERFKREARAVAALNHPNIVTIFSVEEGDGLHFLTMELVSGRSLDRLIPEGGLEAPRILEIAKALSGALAEAHEKGIIHRDLKPANVMVTDDGGVKVLDFGLAKLLNSEAIGGNSELSTAMQTDAGVIMGTRPYMSPEQVQGRPLDHRTDIFSMGVVLYEISTGRRPFQGQSNPDLFASILRDPVPPVTEARADLPGDLSRVIRRCLEKDPRHRIQTARDIGNELRDTARPASPSARTEPTIALSSERAGLTGIDEGFRVAVLPFRYSGTNPDLKALAEGLSEEIVTGLSRFSYLRVIAHGSTKRYANEMVDVRAAGREIGARYVMEGSLRQAGPALRIAVQLVDVTSGAHLWAETYNRPFAPEEIFALQDELVPRIVSTIADTHGVLPRSMSEALRSRPPEQLSAYEAVLRSFGYFDRVTAEELEATRTGLEVALHGAPSYPDALAMLALLNVQEYAQGFSLRPDSLARGLTAARRAVEAAPSSHLAHFSLAQALFFHQELPSFRNAAERAASLNPMDGNSIAFLGELLTYTGDSERGLALAERAKQLNPHHPGWYWYANFYDAYRRGDDRAAVGFAIKVNMPGHWGMHFMKAAACGQLGDRETAGKALQELLKLRPDFAATARDDLEKWWDKDYCDRVIDGLGKAGLALGAGSGGQAAPSLSTPPERATVAIAVLPFSDLSPGKDQEYLCEGMAEEVMSALTGIEGLRVASRTSTFRARQDNSDLAALARVLSVSHVLEGSVRTAGGRLRVTAQLTDVATGFQLWSERFDRDAADIFAVQDEIAAGVVGAVKARLRPGTAPALPARPQVANLEAYRHYLQGRHLRYSKNDHAAALRSFEAALALDPSHAPSMVDLAEVKVLVAIYGLAPTRESYAAAKAAIERATGIQGETSEGLHVLGLIAVCERDWSGAQGSLERALVLEPDNVRALCWSAILNVMRGRVDEARVYLARARDIDPLAPYPYAMSGWALLSAGRTAEAIPLIEQALAFDPDNSLALWTLSMALVAEGRAAEAIPWAERAATPSHSTGVIGGMRGWVLAAAGRIGEAREALQSLRSRPAPCPTLVSEGWILAALGETKEAFAILEKAADESQALVAHVGLPPFETLRSNPRFGALLTKLGLQGAADKVSPEVSRAPSSGAARADEGFRVAVLPFKSSGSSPDLEALADGLSEEIVTGLSRFSYLRVISRGATSRLSSVATDLRAVAKEIGARYVMEGSLRQAGSRLRLAVQLTDAATGAHLWAETYDRPFNTDDIFSLQDDLVPRIVSTVADQHGVLPHSMSALIRNKNDEQLTALEAVLRVFSFHERMSPEEHRKVRALLERTVREHPDEGDCWAMLATLYSDEYMFGFEGEPGPLARAQKTAQRAVEVAPTSWLAAQALAQSLFFRRELQAFRPVAERTITLNPMDSAALAFISLLLALSGAWDRGLEVSEAARKLNPHFPGWYWLTPIFHAYHHKNYRAAIDAASRINMPGYFWAPASQAAAFGQLGEGDSARKAVNELLAIRPDFAAVARDEFGKWFDPELLEHFVDGLVKAGLEVKAVPDLRPLPGNAMAH